MSITINPDGVFLIQAGAVLFLIGLIQGLAIPKFRNSRMALSAHLTAVQSGMALMIFGIIWSLITLELFWLNTAKWSLIASVYIIWIGISLAACSGASKALPIAGNGFTASKTSEVTVVVIETIGIMLSLFSAVLIVIGLFKT